MAAADDDDVYATSDAAWLAEADEPPGDAADDDTGDGDAHDASDDDQMTDDASTTAVAVDQGERSDGPAGATSADVNAATSADVNAAATTAPTDRTPRKNKGKGRATRPGGPGTPASAAPATPGGAVSAGATGGATPGGPTVAADDRGPTTTPDTSTTSAGKTPTTKKKRTPGRQPTATAAATQTAQAQQPVVLRASGLVKRYGQTLAADEVDLEIRQGSIFGVVGPNGAGKTTTLSMVTGLLRPDAGTVTVLDHDVWSDPTAAKRALGVLPDRLRLFDRLTGAQLLHYSATLRGLDGATARKRSADLADAFGLGEALGRQVADYSVGMAKKIALAATLIHSPRVLVLDEPFESVDPVSAATITDILRRYTRGGGTVVLSSHSMELVQRTCDSVAIIVGGKVLASGTMAQVRGRKSLEDKFVELAGGRVVAESMEWLHSFSD
ncbi:ABC transporter ATP-binding protein [Curtobacterium sp. RHCJP20]|uniref:ABC transporter ATP-binding protein n=1 Tax=Curtobacterium subtropicum TaxID=3055138 RepID=A0ABT7TBX6_9MICO|nr:ABC transporter ATP-binding protein [Curtobacterium subtropicum]MDM7887075.1 ABC transporter ATP-binding protein [Curtobacterium subtropicum]